MTPLPAGCILRHPVADLALARARALLVREFPYFDADICTLQPVYAPGFGTFAVTPRRVLIVDPDVLPGGKAAKWTDAEVAGVLCHEQFHLFNAHDTRRVEHGATNARKWNLAADAEINDDLLEMFGRPGITVKLPKTGVFPSTFKLPDNQLAEFYYDRIPDNDAAAPLGGPGGCGGGAGNPSDLEAELDAILGRSDAEVAADRQSLAEAIMEAHAKGQGSIPAGILRTAADYRKPAVVPWERELAVSMRGAVANRPGDRVPTYRRPSRAMLGIGMGVGRPVIAAARATVPRVAVAIDTSGSMTASQCAQGLRETVGVCRAVGASVRYYACDAAVHVAREVHAGTDFASLLVGGGGTAFEPLFDAIAAMPEATRPTLLVLFTDGYGSAPATPPPGLRVIWLLTADGRFPVSWGKVIRLPAA